MKTGTILLVAAVMMALVGCGGSKSSSVTAQSLEYYAGPIASADTAEGQVVWDTYCEGCHPGGAKGKGPNIVDIAWPPAESRKQIREGSGKMPDFGEDKISATELESLLAYLKTINAVQ